MRLCLCVVVAIVLVVGAAPGTSRAIDPAKAPSPIDTSMTEAAFLEKLDRIEQSLRRDGAPPLFSSRPPVIPLTDSPTLYTTNAFGGEGVPYVAMVLRLLNTTASVQTFDPATAVLTADGKQIRFTDVPASIYGFVIDDIAGRSVIIEDAVPKRPILLPPGKVTSITAVFAPVESRGRVPVMTLQLQFGGKPVQLDLNRLHGAMLDAKLARIGPAGACGLITIDGAIDGINAGLLADRLNALNAAGVRRFVIDFGPRCANPSMRTMGWLASPAIRGEIGDLYRSLPSIPTDVASLQFSRLPATVDRGFVEDSHARVHDEVEAAVMEALWAPYRSASRRTVLAELEQGDPRGRAAALACGAQVYRADDLPRLEKWIDDPIRAVRQGACMAIARLESDAARERLRSTVISGSPRSAENALVALLNARRASMMSTGVEAALQPNAIPELALLRILIETRRPVFAERIRNAARSGSQEARVLALEALGLDRSKEAFQVLSEAFTSADRTIRDTALTAASARLELGDQQLRTLVVNEAIRRLRANPSDAVAAEIATRSRDSRVVPILAARLTAAGVAPAERAITVERLAQIGGSEVTEVLIRQFESLTTMEQSTALELVWSEAPERALGFAEKLVASQDSILSEQAREVLVHDGSDRSVAAIRRAIRGEPLPHRQELLQALASIGTPAAYDALVEFRDSGNEELRRFARSAFVMYWSRSPAFEVAQSALRLSESAIPAPPDDVAQAMRLFEQAVELDRMLPQIYQWRGNSLLRQQKWQEAAADFEAAMEIDPYDDVAVTGYAIAWVMLGREDQALSWTEAASVYFDRGEARSNYAYNAACAYSRALGRQLETPQSPGRDEKAVVLRNAAFEHLGRSLDHGFGRSDGELQLLKNDPDLLALHDDARFDAAVKRVTEALKE